MLYHQIFILPKNGSVGIQVPLKPKCSIFDFGALHHLHSDPVRLRISTATSVMIPNRREVYSTTIVVRTESSQLSLTLYVAVMRLLPYGSRVHLGGFCNILVLLNA